MTSQLLFDFDKGYNKTIIGTDEAGRGPGAGGVFASAVFFDKITDGLIRDLEILNDSKKLTAKKRESIFDVIKNNTVNEIICIEVEEIEIKTDLTEYDDNRILFLASPQSKGIPSTIKIVCDNGVYSRYVSMNTTTIGCGCIFKENKYDYEDCEIIKTHKENTVNLKIENEQ